MSSNDDILTEDERDLGFVRAIVTNSGAEFMGNAPLASAVIYVHNECSRIIRVDSEDGSPQYSHQVFGTYSKTGQGKADWQPVEMPYRNPRLAIQVITQGHYQTSVLAQTVYPQQSKLSFPLVCPSCLHRFSVNRGYMLHDEKADCQQCGHAGRAQEFVAELL